MSIPCTHSKGSTETFIMITLWSPTPNFEQKHMKEDFAVPKILLQMLFARDKLLQEKWFLASGKVTFLSHLGVCRQKGFYFYFHNCVSGGTEFLYVHKTKGLPLSISITTYVPGHIKTTNKINHAPDERKCGGDNYISIEFLLFQRGQKLSDILNAL